MSFDPTSPASFGDCSDCPTCGSLYYKCVWAGINTSGVPTNPLAWVNAYTDWDSIPVNSTLEAVFDTSSDSSPASTTTTGGLIGACPGGSGNVGSYYVGGECSVPVGEGAPQVIQRAQLTVPSKGDYCIIATANIVDHVIGTWLIAGCNFTTADWTSDSLTVELVVPPASFSDGTNNYTSIQYSISATTGNTLATNEQVTECIAAGQVSSNYNASLTCTASFAGSPEDPFDDGP